ncbi:MAG: tRNA (adenosine(37)-N6)-threonylcarbamoyltransferase complex ATPase subunit type 1 TsaE [Candidatus Binatia bacterium]
MKSFRVLSRSNAQTQSWGRKLGRLLGGGEIIGLTGELGSGKTCFVRGLAQGLDVDKGAWVRSPSFTLINESDGRVPLFHVDLYRLSSVTEIEELSLRECFFSDGVSVIEWFERLPEDEVYEYLRIHFEHEDANKRKLTFTTHGSRYEEIVEKLRKSK